MFLASCCWTPPNPPPKMQYKHTRYSVFLPASTIVSAVKAACLYHITTFRVYSVLQLGLHFCKFPGVVYIVSLNFTCCVLCSTILQRNQNILSEKQIPTFFINKVDFSTGNNHPNDHLSYTNKRMYSFLFSDFIRKNYGSVLSTVTVEPIMVLFILDLISLPDDQLPYIHTYIYILNDISINMYIYAIFSA